MAKKKIETKSISELIRMQTMKRSKKDRREVITETLFQS